MPRPDPGIHQTSKKFFVKKMDCRVKRGNDERRSMPEMPHTGEHHGDAGIVGGLDDLIVAD
jgi:hypothetical protein